MRKGLGLVAVLTAALLLSGCATPETVPAGLTEDQAKSIKAERDANWWKSMFPDQPQPVVEPIAYRPPGSSRSDIIECIDHPGQQVVTTDNGHVDAANRQAYICELEYPIDLSQPDKLGYFSTAQIGYLYDYYSMRLGPCLAMLGYRVGPAPRRQDFIDGFYTGPYWYPYGAVYLTGPSAKDWQRVDFRCPPPPIGPATH